jgi:hypothetical protein
VALLEGTIQNAQAEAQLARQRAQEVELERDAFRQALQNITDGLDELEANEGIVSGNASCWYYRSSACMTGPHDTPHEVLAVLAHARQVRGEGKNPALDETLGAEK